MSPTDAAAAASPLALADWRARGKSFSYAGHPIFYRDEGRGPVLLLVHGFPTASWDWHAVWPLLSARFRLIAPDLIGFGYSAKPRDYEYSIKDQANLVEALLRALDVTRVHVLAHDYGDTVVQELLARHEERGQRGGARLELASVCLLNGGLFPETHRPRLVQRLLAGPLGPLVGRLTSERRFARSFSALFGARTQPSPTELAALWSLVHGGGGLAIAHKLIRYMQERRDQRERWVGALAHTTVPLLLVDGLADPVSGGHMVARYRELIPRPRVVALEDIGHYPQLEAPQAVARALAELHQHLT